MYNRHGQARGTLTHPLYFILSAAPYVNFTSRHWLKVLSHITDTGPFRACFVTIAVYTEVWTSCFSMYAFTHIRSKFISSVTSSQQIKKYCLWLILCSSSDKFRCDTEPDRTYVKKASDFKFIFFLFIFGIFWCFVLRYYYWLGSLWYVTGKCAYHFGTSIESFGNIYKSSSSMSSLYKFKNSPSALFFP